MTFHAARHHVLFTALALVIGLSTALTLGAIAPDQAGAKKRASAGKMRKVVKMRTYDRRAVSSRSLGIESQSPDNGATVSGTLYWTVRVGGSQVKRVEFRVDGELRSVDRRAPFVHRLDTTDLADGRHALTATAHGGKGRSASTSIVVEVSNGIHSAPEPEPQPAPEPVPAPQPEPQPAPAPQPQPEPTPEPEPAPQPEPEPAPAPQPEPQPEPTPAPPSSQPIFWGAWIGNHLTGDEAPWDMNAVATLEQKVSKKLSIVNFSAPFANCSGSTCKYYNFPVNEFNAIRGHGAIPFYSWGSQSIPVSANLSQPNFQLSDVIEGRHDSYIRSFAVAARNWGKPFFLRFNWEMNGGWFAWAEGVNGNKNGEFVAAWRHVVDIFKEVGADNATWVWCPNVDPEGKFQALQGLYPGDAYVDWTGLDGYNWGTNPARPDRWRSFDSLYRSSYELITEQIAPAKPMIVSEVGSTEYGGSKAAWIKDMLAKVPVDYPKIRGLLWFEKYDDGMDWPLVTSASASGAFAEGISAPAYSSNTFGGLTSGSVLPAS